MILLVADKASVVAPSLSALRLEIGRRTGVMDPTELAFCWVMDFPLLEYSEERGALVRACITPSPPPGTKIGPSWRATRARCGPRPMM